MPNLEELQNKIVSLEERALYLADLANCMPDHQGWLWNAEEHVRREVERLKFLLANEETRRTACA